MIVTSDSLLCVGICRLVDIVAKKDYKERPHSDTASVILTSRVPATSTHTLFISLFSVVTILVLRRDANYPLPNVF